MIEEELELINARKHYEQVKREVFYVCAFSIIALLILLGLITVAAATDFNEMWDDRIPFAVSTVKTDRLRPATTDTKALTPMPAAQPFDEKQFAEEVKHIKRLRSRDICQRHGMHKRWTRNGRSWRCRK